MSQRMGYRRGHSTPATPTLSPPGSPSADPPGTHRPALLLAVPSGPGNWTRTTDDLVPPYSWPSPLGPTTGRGPRMTSVISIRYPVEDPCRNQGLHP